jgi:hypothetical protein
MKDIKFLFLSFFTFLLMTASCSKDDELVINNPTIEITSTEQNNEVTYTSIKISGNVTSDGGDEITARGVCWSTNTTPTINDSKTEETSNTFTSLIENLTANTTYYFRVYATNSSGTSYSDEQVYSTSSLVNTKWDFLLIHSSTVSWHADVTFNEDGTTVYDEPDFPGQYLTNGTWSISDNTLTYDMDSSDDSNTSYQFVGPLSGNTMSGTYSFGTETKNWTATKY